MNTRVSSIPVHQASWQQRGWSWPSLIINPCSLLAIARKNYPFTSLPFLLDTSRRPTRRTSRWMTWWFPTLIAPSTWDLAINVPKGSSAWISTYRAKNRSVELHFAVEQPVVSASNDSLSQELENDLSNKWAQQSTLAKRDARSKQMIKRCKWTSMSGFLVSSAP